MVKSIRVLIADDQPRARQSLRALLTTLPLTLEIREAVNGSEAIDAIETFKPDLVILDVRMPVMDGLEAAYVIKQQWPETKIIIYSMYPEYSEIALTSGAERFIDKSDPPEKLLAEITRMMSDGTSSIGLVPNNGGQTCPE
jgi:YesN/AraC family two-component response regulator